MTVNVISLEHPRGYPAEYVSDFVAGRRNAVYCSSDTQR